MKCIWRLNVFFKTQEKRQIVTKLLQYKMLKIVLQALIMPTNILLLRTNFRYKSLWLARGYKMELSEIENFGRR